MPRMGGAANPTRACDRSVWFVATVEGRPERHLRVGAVELAAVFHSSR